MRGCAEGSSPGAGLLLDGHRAHIDLAFARRVPIVPHPRACTCAGPGAPRRVRPTLERVSPSAALTRRALESLGHHGVHQGRRGDQRHLARRGRPPVVELLAVEKTYPNGTRAVDPRRPRDRRGRVRHAARAVGLRQVDAAQDDRRARRAFRRADPLVGRGLRRGRPAGPQARDGVPGSDADALVARAPERSAAARPRARRTRRRRPGGGRARSRSSGSSSSRTTIRASSRAACRCASRSPARS